VNKNLKKKSEEPEDPEPKIKKKSSVNSPPKADDKKTMEIEPVKPKQLNNPINPINLPSNKGSQIQASKFSEDGRDTVKKVLQEDSSLLTRYEELLKEHTALKIELERLKASFPKRRMVRGSGFSLCKRL